MRARIILGAVILAAFAGALLAVDVEDQDSRKYRSVVLQNAATTGNGVAWDMSGNNNHVWLRITFTKNTSAGAITIEGAEANAATGAWEPMAPPITVAAAAAGCGDTVPLGGVCRARVDLYAPGAIQAIRARISTTVADGTVTVTAYAAR